MIIKATLLDHMGSDLTVVNAARVSFGKKSESMDERDEKLIHYLGKHKHISPFGHCFASFHVKAPVFVARQLVKHKFLRWNEISRRYVDEPAEFYLPNPFRYAAKDKKQGSSGNANSAVMHDEFDHDLAEHMEKSQELYAEMIDRGIAPELARGWLPQAAFTEWYWSGSLDAFSSMCNLRCTSDTQHETRLVAEQIDEQMAEIFPVSWQALAGRC